MPDFSFVTARLATGAAISGPEDAALIAAAGITHVVDVTDSGDDTPLFVALPSVHVLWNPTGDDGEPKPPEWFAASLAFALPALAQPYARVYAHCSAGVNRGPSTAAAIMMALGWTLDAACALIREKRPQVGLAYAGDALAAIIALGYDGGNPPS